MYHRREFERMADILARLLSAAGGPLLPPWRAQDSEFVGARGALGAELLELLARRNGFFAFESALHTFPLGTVPGRLDLRRWNEPETWCGAFSEMIPRDELFFAQDVFGNQFSLGTGGVSVFYPEFGQFEPLASSVAGWAELFLADWRGFSGYELSHAWQVRNRPLAEGERLIPKVPFVLGGKYDVGNLYAGDIIDAMRFRASLARQVANFPDGTLVRIRVTHGSAKTNGDGDER
jgi:hypothetical protein